MINKIVFKHKYDIWKFYTCNINKYILFYKSCFTIFLPKYPPPLNKALASLGFTKYMVFYQKHILELLSIVTFTIFLFSIVTFTIFLPKTHFGITKYCYFYNFLPKTHFGITKYCYF